MTGAGASNRARANHELYLAKIVLDAWRGELERQQVPASTLAQAFEGGVRDHLIAAYGWFLLTLTQAQVPPDGPPRCCDELSPVPAGKVLPAEINEFRRLESSGWLGDMLRPGAAEMTAPRGRDSLAFEAVGQPGHEQADQWLQRLDALFGRMGDALNEF